MWKKSVKVKTETAVVENYLPEPNGGRKSYIEKSAVLVLNEVKVLAGPYSQGVEKKALVFSVHIN
jgi:hypothetical protein